MADAGLGVERTDFVGIPSAFFQDPDGNALILRHRYARYRDGTTP